MQAYAAARATSEERSDRDAEALPEEAWGKPPAKLAGIGIEESDRKCLAAARMYTVSYLRLMYLTCDVATMQAAIPVLKQPQSAEADVSLRWSDLAR